MLRDPRRVTVVPFEHPAGCRSYLVVAPETQEAAVIDPLLTNVQEIAAALESQRAKLNWIIDTHTHGDHVSGSILLRERSGGEIVRHPEAPGSVATYTPQDGERLVFGEHGLAIHFAPGNSIDSLVVEAPGCMFTGDTLLIGTVGLSDTRTVDGKAWFASLARVFGDVSDETILHPGHDDMGRHHTTMGSERAGNLWIREESEDKFLTMLRGDDRRPRKDADIIRALYEEGATTLPPGIEAATGLTAPATVAEQAAARSRGRPEPVRATASAPLNPWVLVMSGLLAIAGPVLGWTLHPGLHALSLVAAFMLLASGLPALDRSRRRQKASPTLYYPGPAPTHTHLFGSNS